MKKLWKIIRNFVNRTRNDNVSVYASSCAFFIFLSLVPVIILFLAILPYTPIDIEFVFGFIRERFPAKTGEFLVKVIDDYYERSLGVLSLSIIGAFWSAGKGVNSLMNGLNAIDGYKDKRNPITVRLISCFYTLIFLLGVLFLLIIVVWGKVINNFLSDYFPHIGNVMEVFVNFRSLLSLGILTILFMLCYALLPYKKHRIREQIPGALFSAALWTGFSYLFSMYVNMFNAFSIYGSLTAIIIMLFWLYICMQFVFIGANLNKYFRPVIAEIHKKGSTISDVKGQLESLEE